GETVVDRDAVVELLPRRAALDREAVLVVAVREVADVDVVRGEQMVIAVVAIAPGPVEVAEIPRRARLHVQAGVLIVMKVVPADDVVRGAEQIEPIGFADVGACVPGALVVLEGGPRDTRDHRDAMIAVVVAYVRTDQET